MVIGIGQKAVLLAHFIPCSVWQQSHSHLCRSSSLHALLSVNGLPLATLTWNCALSRRFSFSCAVTKIGAMNAIPHDLSRASVIDQFLHFLPL